MAVVKTIEPNVGCGASSESTIATYITLLKQNLVYTFTDVDVMGVLFPIGRFNEDEMDLYLDGVNIVNSINYNDWLRGLPEEGRKRIVTNWVNGYIDSLFDRYHDVPFISEVLRSFDKICTDNGKTFMTKEQWEEVETRIKVSKRQQRKLEQKDDDN